MAVMHTRWMCLELDDMGISTRVVAEALMRGDVSWARVKRAQAVLHVVRARTGSMLRRLAG